MAIVTTQLAQISYQLRSERESCSTSRALEKFEFQALSRRNGLPRACNKTQIAAHNQSVLIGKIEVVRCCARQYRSSKFVLALRFSGHSGPVSILPFAAIRRVVEIWL